MLNLFRRKKDVTPDPPKEVRAVVGRTEITIMFDDPELDFDKVFEGYAGTSYFMSRQITFKTESFKDLYFKWLEKITKEGFVTFAGESLPVRRIQKIVIHHDPTYEVIATDLDNRY